MRGIGSVQKKDKKEGGMRRSVMHKAAACFFLCGLFCMSGCGQQEAEETDVPNMTDVSDATDVSEGKNAVDMLGMAAEENTMYGLQTADSMQEDAERQEPEEANIMAGKKLAIVGDSISTFVEWIPEGYYDFYPMHGEGVEEVGQTWWKMVLDDMDMELCVNTSSAGSTCVGNSLGMDDPQCGCSEFRMGDLSGTGGTYPDIIIVFMGANDFLKGIPIGENDGTQYVEEGEVDNFSDAYCLMLDKLAAYYPGADIFCCTLTPIGDWGEKQPFVEFINRLELTSEDYGRKIEEIASAKGCTVIDLAHCGITFDNMDDYVSDGTHLMADGMILVRDAVEAALTGFYYDS